MSGTEAKGQIVEKKMLLVLLSLRTLPGFYELCQKPVAETNIYTFFFLIIPLSANYCLKDKKGSPLVFVNFYWTPAVLIPFHTTALMIQG